MFTDFDEGFFSKRLSYLRNKKGISARDMSLSIGQSESYINSIENQRALPSLKIFFIICDFLSVTPQEFFAIHEKSDVLIEKITKNILKLDAEQLQILYDLTKNMSEGRD